MQDSGDIRDFLWMLRRRRWFVLIWSALVLSIAISLAYGLPSKYRSSGTLLFEESDISADLVQSTVTTFADQEIELLRRRVMTIDTLKGLVEEIDPYPDADGMSVRDKAIEVRANTWIEQVDPVTLEPSVDHPAYTLHFTHPEPDMAKKMAAAIIDLFLEDNLQRRTESARGAYELLAAESEKLREELDAAEARLSEFKKEHGDALPESQRNAEQLLNRARDELFDLNRQLRAAQERRALLLLRLQQVSPSLVGAMQDWRTELAQLEAELAEARQKYTPDHPDVRRLQTAIQRLKTEEGAGLQSRNQTELARLEAELAEARERYTDEHPEVKRLTAQIRNVRAREASEQQDGAGVQADNPFYLESQSQLEAVNREISALQREISAQEAEIDEYNQRMVRAPEVEQEYAALNRDYQIAQDKYREVKAKEAEAEFSIILEANRRGETISLIMEPFVPDSPHSPNRLGIILLGIVLAAGGAIGVSLLLEMTDNTVRGSRDLQAIMEMPAIAAIPYIRNPADVNRTRAALVFGSAGLILIVASVVYLTSTLTTQ